MILAATEDWVPTALGAAGAILWSVLAYLGTRKGRAETTNALVASAVAMTETHGAAEERAWQRAQKLEDEVDELKAELAMCNLRHVESDQVIAKLRSDLDAMMKMLEGYGLTPEDGGTTPPVG